MGDEEPELHGIEDEFDQQFADELDVLAELEGKQPPAPSHKLSSFRNQKKRTFEEALAAGDLGKDSVAPVRRPRLKKESCSQTFPKETCDDAPLEPEDVPTFNRVEDDLGALLLQEAEGAQTPRPKRRCLEAVKKLDFGVKEKTALEVRPKDGIASPSGACSESQESRTPRRVVLDSLGESDMLLLQATPPEEGAPRKVLKRPPILEDYINVTSTDGTRVFMVVRENCSWTGVQPSSSLGWNRQRPLYLLGMPFSYLKEQVAEERRRRIRESSRRLTEILDSCLEDERIETEATEPGEEGGSGGAVKEDESATGSLWVDRFAPKDYVELLSDVYTNRCLLKWLKLWDVVVFGKDKPAKKAKPSAEAQPPSKRPKDWPGTWKTKAQLTEESLEAELDQHNRPKFKVALLCGPPGLGKTTLAHIIAKHAGYNAVEMNASDDRSPDIFKTRIEAATQMRSVLGAHERPNCLIIDEIDGAPVASVNVLLNIVNWKGTEAEGAAGAASGRKRKQEGGVLLRPIICICNDQYVPSLRQLRQQSFLLHFPSTDPSRLAQRLHEIAVQQGMKADTGALLALCEKTENDIRSCVNTLQFLHSRGQKEVTVRTVQTTNVGMKDQNKGLFFIWQEIFQLPKIQRHRIGMDASNPVSVLVSSGDVPFGSATVQTSLNATAQRFHRILHLGSSSGEHEKLTQVFISGAGPHCRRLLNSGTFPLPSSPRARCRKSLLLTMKKKKSLDVYPPPFSPGLFDNFLNMKVKDSSLGSVCLALEWLGFSDMSLRVVLHRQNFQLMRYQPFLPVAFHMLFAASSIPRLAYPNSQNEALAKLTQVQNLVASMISGITPNFRSRVGSQSLVLEALCLLLDIISPKLRPVNTQLYSRKEKQQLSELISTMLAYNLTYHQERTPDGQYVYKLDPNVEEICRFPDLPARKQLTYQAKQLIAREIELEKMRRTEAALQARNSSQELAGSPVAKEASQKASSLSQARNHEQRLDKIVKRATFAEKPETDFFGRVIVKKNVSPSTDNQRPEKNTNEKRVGRAVGASDVWFRFNEGVSNAVRRNIYIKDLI
ncbi:chromosome transmission fidelity protein 18 homolog isoform X2 [Sphaerodactylus townsendi]|uniref:chromosome transmission fidelity protein 18 homolog isoform X2 n=1 Tax=Sphaerodactylus townsendi TaxID=933632 RepID=UPI002026CDF3|nr:chromosome transmission fidelity protein 18 homolog isoform X2 [Sphaerodactylus townsendi]